MDNSKLVASQEQKIKKYEQKMRDLIEAYKTLQNEKKNLEDMVKLLSTKEPNSDGKPITELERLRSQITNLNEEKNKMEKKFQDDKKITRAEYESVTEILKEKLNRKRESIEKLTLMVDELKLENRKLKDSCKFLTSKEQSMTYKIENLEQDLQSEKNLVKEYTTKIEQQRLIKEDIENQLLYIKTANENRVLELESTISDLSKTIGELEKQNHINVDTIMTLQEKYKQLSEVKIFHSTRLDSQSDTPDILQFSDVEKNSIENDIQTVINRISNLRTQLFKLDPNFDFITLISDSEAIPPVSSLSLRNCLTCNENQIKVDKLEEQLDEYKRHEKLNDLDVAINLGQGSNTTQIMKELSDSQKKITELQEEMNSNDKISIQNQKMLKDTILKNEWNYKQEISRLKLEHNKLVSELQSELTKHRNRTINLLFEKDSEIQSLQKKLAELQYYQQQIRQGEKPVPDEEFESSSVADTVELSQMLPRVDNSCPLYQCCETKARMELELRKLRHLKRQLESKIHKLEADIEYIRSDWSNEVATLNEQLQMLQSSYTSSSMVQLTPVFGLDSNKLSGPPVNLEYLRNVFRSFIQTDDSSSRRLMMKAMGQMLQLSANELKNIRSLKL